MIAVNKIYVSKISKISNYTLYITVLNIKINVVFRMLQK